MRLACFSPARPRLFAPGLAVWIAICLSATTMPAGADPGFRSFLQSLWPEAQKLGVPRAVFDGATRGLAPDLSLPDLIIPGQPPAAQPGQAEFVQTPGQYLGERGLAAMAARGRKLAAEHRATLARIEQRFGVPPEIVLAIWGRETAFGAARLRHNAIRVLATQAYVGRRKTQFRQEFLLALKMLADGHVRLADMHSSWAGAMGHTQFLPSDFYKNGVDFDGNGRIDIWNSIPDALASAAKQLVDKGWRRGQHWAYEVRVPANADCSLGHPGHVRPLGQWIADGFAPLGPRRPSPQEREARTSLLMPEGSYGPAFLTLPNYFVIKEYNFSDLYVLYVGNLADRIAGGGAFRTPWSKNTQLRSSEVELMQQRLAELGLYTDKLDGKAGMLTRAALGAYQKRHGLKVDCWPTAAVLDHMRRSGR